MDDGWLADLIAFLWWKRDHDNDEHQPVSAQPQPKHDPIVPKAWDAVVTEWEPDERPGH